MQSRKSKMGSGRRWSLIVSFALIFAIMGITFTPISFNSQAQDYSFSVEEERITITINNDGSIDIEYYLTFINYEKMDGVDIGLPNEYYDINSAQAAVYVDGDQNLVRLIRKSPYVEIGVAVEFTQSVRNQIEYIPGGKEFSLHFKINNPHMVYEDDRNPSNAGIKFRPTWFDPSFQRGDTDIILVDVRLPLRLNSTGSVKYLLGHPYDSLYYDDSLSRYVAKWTYRHVSPSETERGEADVGISFTKSAVDKYFVITIWDQLGDIFVSILGLLCICSPFIFVGMIFAIIYYMDRKRRVDYFEPEMSVVGAGPRRDLTAPEAAVVLEIPLDKVATMILFGLVKKRKVEIIQESPLQLRILPFESLRLYERNFIDSITYYGTIDSSKMEKALVSLIKDVKKMLRGFDYNATKSYYKSIVERAWNQVTSAKTPDVFHRSINANSEWLIMDKKYDDRLRDYYVVFQSGSYYGEGGLTHRPDTSSIPQMAHGYISRVESLSKGLIDNISSFTERITKVTNPPPVSSGGGGGGFSGGGGCACACACACAGGGR
jgi:hypothetical protein